MKETTAVGVQTTLKPYRYLYGPQFAGTLAQYLTDQQIDPELIEFGAVYVNHARVTDRGMEVGAKDIIRVHFNPKRYVVDQNDLKKRVVFEDEHYVVVNKPSGLPMHPTLDNLRENLIYGLREELLVTHRLDVPTSGLVVLAKAKESQGAFNKLISKRGVKKAYVATTLKPLPVGILSHFIVDTVKAPKKVVAQIPQDAVAGEKFQDCHLKILKVTSNAETYFLDIELLTGRTHQIRAQLSFEGAPIVGDEMYGGQPWPYFGLTANRLEFVCPMTKETRVFSIS